MIVTTINKEYISSVSLPQKPTGQYWLYGKSQDWMERLVSIEGINEKWVLKSSRQIKLLDSKGNTLKNTVISPLSIYVLLKSNSEKIFVFTEPITDDRQTFVKYLTDKNINLSIGRNEHNDICFDSKVVSANHATLSCKEGNWYLRDENSTNGTFVNGKKVIQTSLKVGDVIFVMGLKIIIGKYFIAINNPDRKVFVTNKLTKFVSQKVQPIDEDEEYELAEKEYFYRSPRFKRDIETATFKIDSPPASPISEEMPWLLVMGSSMAMGMMSLVTLTSAIATMNVTSMFMGGSMLIGTLLLPTITKSYERNHKRKKEELRQKKYREYLDKISVQIDEVCREQEEILNENNITIQNCENRIKEVQRNLWERSMGQSDFLTVRVGYGEGLLNAQFSYQERKFSIDDDNLQEELYSLCEKPKQLHNIPITYSVLDDYISGIIGNREKVIGFAKGLIIQLAALYSYDEVKFVFLYDQKENEHFEFVKWLPHVWSDDNKIRLIATNTNEVKEVSAFLENVISARSEINESDMEEVSPYYIIFSMSKDLSANSEMVKQILTKKKNIHISLITFYDELKSLPKECSMVVEITGQDGRLFNKNDITLQSIEFTPDIYLSQDPLELSVQLSNMANSDFWESSRVPIMFNSVGANNMSGYKHRIHTLEIKLGYILRY